MRPRRFRVFTCDRGVFLLDADDDPLERMTAVLQEAIESGFWQELDRFPTDAIARARRRASPTPRPAASFDGQPRSLPFPDSADESVCHVASPVSVGVRQQARNDQTSHASEIYARIANGCSAADRVCQGRAQARPTHSGASEQLAVTARVRRT